MISVERVIFAVGAVIAALLQVLLASHIAIGYAVPNFMAAYCIALAIARSDAFGPVLPFVVGLVYDLVSGGPVGAMAFTLTAVSMGAAWLFQRANNDTWFMAIAVLLASVLVLELMHGAFFLLFGYAASFIEALAYRIVPCFVYDAALALALYFLLARLLTREAPLQSEIKHLQ